MQDLFKNQQPVDSFKTADSFKTHHSFNHPAEDNTYSKYTVTEPDYPSYTVEEKNYPKYTVTEPNDVTKPIFGYPVEENSNFGYPVEETWTPKKSTGSINKSSSFVDRYLSGKSSTIKSAVESEKPKSRKDLAVPTPNNPVQTHKNDTLSTHKNQTVLTAQSKDPMRTHKNDILSTHINQTVLTTQSKDPTPTHRDGTLSMYQNETTTVRVHSTDSSTESVRRQVSESHSRRDPSTSLISKYTDKNYTSTNQSTHSNVRTTPEPVKRTDKMNQSVRRKESSSTTVESVRRKELLSDLPTNSSRKTEISNSSYDQSVRQKEYCRTKTDLSAEKVSKVSASTKNTTSSYVEQNSRNGYEASTTSSRNSAYCSTESFNPLRHSKSVGGWSSIQAPKTCRYEEG